MVYVKIIHEGRDVKDVEKDAESNGLVSQSISFTPGNPIFGQIDPSKIDALKLIPGVKDVISWHHSTGDTPFDDVGRLNPH